MTERDDLDPPEDDMEMLAAEYVLGLLTPAQLPHVVASRRGSLRFDRAVSQWEVLLLPLAEAVEPVEPRPLVWAAISRALRSGPEKPRRATAGFWDSLNFWRGFGLGAGALCAVLIAVFVLRQPPLVPMPATIATATLDAKTQGIFVATAETVAAGTRLVISPSQVTIPPGKSAELWLIVPGKNAAALGLLASNRPLAVIVPAAELSAGISQAKLAISIEPPGGSPTGQATGPVVAVANFLPL